MPLTIESKARLRHVRLNVWEVKMIQFIANDQGEISFDWRNVRIDIRRALVTLCDKQMIEVITPVSRIQLYVKGLVDHPALTRIRLSDQGRAVLDSMGQMTV